MIVMVVMMKLKSNVRRWFGFYSTTAPYDTSVCVLLDLSMPAFIPVLRSIGAARLIDSMLTGVCFLMIFVL